MYHRSVIFLANAIPVTGSPQALPEFTVPMVAGRTYYIEHEFRIATPAAFVADAPGGSTGHYGGAAFGAGVFSQQAQTRLMGVVVAGADGDFSIAGIPDNPFTIEALAVLRVEEYGP